MKIGIVTAISVTLLFPGAAITQKPAPKRKAPAIEKITPLQDGSLQITLSDGRLINQPTLHRDEDSENGGEGTFTNSQIAEDGSVAGWFVEFRWPGVSYKIAQVLAVYRPGRPLKYVAPVDINYLVLVDWRFVRGGKQVAFERQALHGPDPPIFELHDFESDKVMGRWDGELTAKSPAWTNAFK